MMENTCHFGMNKEGVLKKNIKYKKEEIVKNKIFVLLITVCLSVTFIACGEQESGNQEEINLTNVAVDAPKDEVGNMPQSSNIVQCGEEYNAGDLSYNIIQVEVKNGVLRINMEVFNNSSEDINFSPMDTLTVFNDNNEECSWNMMVGKLGGLITPNNKIVGETGFDIDTMETDNYVLHIGESFEFKPAIEIASGDIGMEFAKIFEGSGLDSEYTIGVPVESEGFDMLITGASVKPSNKEGQEIVLIDLSMTNNDTESHALGFEISGVYADSGTALNTAHNDWTFRNYDIESDETAIGIVSYYCDAGEKDFYMTVKPDINDFSRQEIITFSVQ